MMAERDPVPDWAQVAEASPFTPPASSATPTILIALAIVVAGVAAVLGYRGWMTGGETAKLAPAPVIARTTAPSVVPRAEAAQKARLEEQLRQAMRAQTWTRCQVGEQVVYSDAGCGAGVAQRSSADSQAPVTAISSMPETAASHTLYRCKPYSGGAFWSTRHCNQQEALVDRMTTVPRNLTLNQKIPLAERSLKKTQPSVQQSTAQVPQRSAASPDKQTECSELNKLIQHIDAQTRQPLPAFEQDQLRGQRKAARDKQFALRCGQG